MAKLIIEDTTLKNIADAIRNKNGETTEYLPSEMPVKIEEIETGSGTGSGYTIKYINGAIKDKKVTSDELLNDIENGTWINGKNMFYNAGDYFDYTLLDGKNLKLTDCSRMFYSTEKTYKLSNVDMSNFDVSKVLDFSYMFAYCNHVTDLDISNFNMNNAENCSNMFVNSSKLKTVKLGELDNCNVKDLSNMFSNCKVLTNIEGIENIDVSNCETFEKMFYYCSELKDFNLDLTNWEINKNTSSSASFSCFLQYAVLKSIKFADDAQLGFGSMFYQSKILEKVDLGKTSLHKNTSGISNMLHYADLPGGIILPNFGHVNSDIVLGNSSTKICDLTFGEGNSFGNTSTKASLVLNITNIWRNSAENACLAGYGEGTYGDKYEAFANSIAPNTSGLTRTIKLHTLLYNSLSDEQKALLTDKGYTLSFGTS